MSGETAEGCVQVHLGEALARYGFGEGHPFGPDRLDAFWNEARRRGLERRVRIVVPASATADEIARFHRPRHVARVQEASEKGEGYLDAGDTPAFPGVFEAAATVVGTVVDAARRIVAGECRRAFVPIAGLHHASREGATGFCVFNDLGVAIETLRLEFGLQRILYVDIDAHHGDGVFYAYQDDPRLAIVDFHEDGRYLYPGTGGAGETGKGMGRGTKLNIPLPPGARDERFLEAWPDAEAFMERFEPRFILLQCGADCIEGDPITHLRLTPEIHRFVTRRLCRLAGRHAEGRLLATGGGGYNRPNLAAAWCNVVEAMLESEAAEGS